MTTAARRDASWYRKPGTSYRYHVADGPRPACNHSTLLDTSTSIPARLVPENLRCRRPGCRQQWPAVAPDEP